MMVCLLCVSMSQTVTPGSKVNAARCCREGATLEGNCKSNKRESEGDFKT